MAGQDPRILIQAILDVQASQTIINKQVENIKAQALKIGVDLDTSNAKKILKDLQNQPILQLKSDQLNSRIQTWMNNNTKAAKLYDEQLQQIIASTKEVNSKSDLTSVSQQFKTVQRNAEALGVTGESVLEKFKSDLGTFTTFLSAGTLIMSGVNALRQMVSTIKDLNKAATDLQMVTGGNSQQTADLLKSYNQLGTELGATTTEVAASASDFLRQGKSIEETNTLIKDSMILSKVSNIDSADATTYLTSAMKGYNVAANDTIGIVDKLNAVDLVSATSAAGLAEGMSRTANAANIAGVSMDKLLGYLAVVGETTQKDMSEVGTSFQAIFSRMGNVAAGKDIDAEGESLNNVETVLTKVGIKLRDSQSQFRNFGSVLDEVAGKWKGYSNVEQNQIATAIAGTRQRENFLVLMQNYSKATEYATTAQNSNGSAMKKMEVYENSIEAATKRATAAWEAFSTSILNSDVIKFFINLGAGAGNALTGINNQFGALPTLIGAASLALSAFGKNYKALQLQEVTNDDGTTSQKLNLSYNVKKQAKSEAANQLANDIEALTNYQNGIQTASDKTAFFNTTMGKASKTAQEYAGQIKDGKGSVEIFTAEQKVATTATTGLGIASKAAAIGVNILNAALTMEIAVIASAAIEGLVSVIDNAVNASQKQKEAAENATQAYEDAKSKITETNTQLENANKQIDELKAKGALTFVEQDQLKTLQNTTQELKTQKKIQEELAKVKPEEASNEALKVANAKDKTSRYETTTTPNVSINPYDIVKNKGIVGTKTQATQITDVKYVQEEIQYYDELSQKLQDASDAYNALQNPTIEQTEAFKNQSASLKSDMDSTHATIVKETDSIDANAKSITTNTDVGRTYLGEVQAMDTAVQEHINSVNTSTSSNQNNTSSIVENASAVESTASSLSDLSAKFSAVNTKITTLQSIQDSYNQTGYISADMLSQLAANNGDLMQYIDIVNGKLVLNTDALTNNASMLKEQMITTEQASLATNIYGIIQEDMTTNASDAGNATATAKGQISSMDATMRNAAIGAQILALGYDSVKNAFNGDPNINTNNLSANAQAKIQSAINNTKSYIDTISKLNIGTGKSTEATKANTQAQKDQTDAQKAAKQAADDQTKSLEKQKDALSDLISDMKDAQSAINTEVDNVKAMLKQRYEDEIDSIKAVEDEKEKAHEQTTQNLEDEYDAFKETNENQKKTIEDETNAIQKKISAQEELLDLLEDEHDYQSELADKNKSLSDLQAEMVTLNLDDSESAKKRKLELQNEISEQQKTLNEFEHDQSIKLQKDALEKEADKYSDTKDKEIDKLDKELSVYEKNHKKKLADIDAEYNKTKNTLDKQISDIQAYTSKEVNLRTEAMNLINQGGQQLYNDLMDYNRIYGVTITCHLPSYSNVR